MFEASLKSKFEQIFQVKKVTYDQPSEQTREQDVLFIQIEMARNTLKEARQISRVTGVGRIYSQHDKMSYGFFSKKIHEASNRDPALTKDLFFSDFEENTNYFVNLVERTFSFVYFFDSQYDPEVGSLTSLTIEEITE